MGVTDGSRKESGHHGVEESTFQSVLQTRMESSTS